MKKTLLKALALMLALLMVIPFTSCKKDKEEDNTKGTTSGSTIEYPDYEGYEFRVLIEEAGWQHMDFDCEEYSGDLVDKSLYTRNRTMEDDYNIKLIQTSSGNAGTANEAMKTDILAGNYTYDLLFAFANHCLPLAAEGMFLDLKTVEGLDLSASCWDANAVRDLSISNKLYCVTGDIHFGAYDAVSMLLFNRDLASENQIEEDVRQLALEGKWYMETLKQLIIKVASDADNDSEYLDQDDMFGISSTTAIWTNIMIGGNAPFFTKSGEDIPVYSATADRFDKVFTSMMQMITSNNCYIPNGSNDKDNANGKNAVAGDTYRDVFNNGHALFMGGVVADLDNVKARESGINYSPIPLPKFDSDQTSYYNAVNFQVGVMYMPIGKDANRTAVITQALCERSTNTLKAAYYEQCLKTQRAKDDIDSQLLDLVFSTRYYDIGLAITGGTVRSAFNGELAGMFLTALGSFNKKNASSANEKINTFVDSLNGQ